MHLRNGDERMRRKIHKTKKIMSVVIAAALTMGLTACGKGNEPKEQEKAIPDELNVMVWGSFWSDEAFEKFEEKYNCHVNVNYITNSDELLTKIQNGEDYDLIQVEHSYVKTFVDAGILQKNDLEDMPNIKNLPDDLWGPIGDENNEYVFPDGSVPLCSTVVYNKETCPVSITSFKDLTDEKLNGQVVLPESSCTLFGFALNALGYDVSSTDENEMEEAYNLLCSIKKNVKAFSGGSGVTSLENGEASVALIYGTDWPILNEKEENRGKFEIADIEGYEMPLSSWGIPESSTHKYGAEQLANFLVEPEIFALSIEEYPAPYSSVPETADYLSEDIINNPGLEMPDYVTQKGWRQSVSPEMLSLVDKYYTKFKSE